MLARPLPLSDEQKRTILAAIAGTPAPVALIDAAPPEMLASSVELFDLPTDLADMPALRGYKFVKLADKVIFVAPANRIVIGEITK